MRGEESMDYEEPVQTSETDDDDDDSSYSDSDFHYLMADELVGYVQV